MVFKAALVVEAVLVEVVAVVEHAAVVPCGLDVKEPTHCSKRVGDVVPGVMVYHLFCSDGTCVSY